MKIIYDESNEVNDINSMEDVSGGFTISFGGTGVGVGLENGGLHVTSTILVVKSDVDVKISGTALPGF